MSRSSHTYPSLPAEIDLLRFCAGEEIDSAGRGRIEEILRGDIDWPRLLARAQHHALIPLLFTRLNADFRHLVPPEQLAELRRRFAAIGRHNLTLTGELLALLSGMEERGITALPYKGPVAAVTLYENLALRPFADLDLLVRERDLWPAADLLLDAGYRSPVELTAELRAGPLPAEGQLLFEREPRVVIELHWRVAQQYFAPAFDYEVLRERCATVEISGRAVPTLSPEDTLLILSVHNTKHGWERLIWIADIARFVRAHPALDWENVLRRAGALDLERMVTLGLRLAHELLGAAIPPAIARRVMDDRSIDPLVDQVIARLASGADRLSDIAERRAFHLGSWEESGGRRRYWVARIFVPTLEDRRALSLPRPLFFLYYLLRPLRLALKHGADALRGSGRRGDPLAERRDHP